MASNFLHEEKEIPPDELAERDAPACPKCGQQMWVIRVETQLFDGGTRSIRQYECSPCGTKQALRTESNQISPMATTAVGRGT
jgi:ribosomal protein L37AE/L43A